MAAADFSAFQQSKKSRHLRRLQVYRTGRSSTSGGEPLYRQVRRIETVCPSTINPTLRAEFEHALGCLFGGLFCNFRTFEPGDLFPEQRHPFVEFVDGEG